MNRRIERRFPLSGLYESRRKDPDKVLKADFFLQE